MPAKSVRQYGLMQAAAHGQSEKVPPEVARRFIEETPAEKRSAFARLAAKKRRKP